MGHVPLLHCANDLRDAFGRVVRQRQEGPETGPTYYTVPGDVTFDQALYFREGSGTPAIKEWGIAGLGRIGVDRTVTPTHNGPYYTRTLGTVFYELKDIQGSVRAVVKDYVKPDPAVANRYIADVAAATDYDAYGAWRFGRTTSMAEPYRYMWHGMRRPDGLADPHMYITPFRLYDVRLGRWNTRDPIFDPSASPYEGMGSNPISLTDIMGLNPGGNKAAEDVIRPKEQQPSGNRGPAIPTQVPVTTQNQNAIISFGSPLRTVVVDGQMIQAAMTGAAAKKAEDDRRRLGQQADQNRSRSAGQSDATGVAPKAQRVAEDNTNDMASPYMGLIHPEAKDIPIVAPPALRSVESWDRFSPYPVTPENGPYRRLFMALALMDFVAAIGVGATVGRRTASPAKMAGSSLPALARRQSPRSMQQTVQLPPPSPLTRPGPGVVKSYPKPHYIAGTERKQWAMPGSQLARYGSLAGQFMTEPGTHWSWLSLTAVPTQQYLITFVQPLEIVVSRVAPHGASMQYQLTGKATLRDLLDLGVIRAEQIPLPE